MTSGAPPAGETRPPASPSRSAIAVGVFDGFHLGHRVIVERALARARQHGDGCVVVSFDPHPDVVLAKVFRSEPPLTPLPERRALLAALGAELHVLPFTRELASLSPEEFVDRHLIEPFRPRALVVGEGFALGRARAGDVPRLSAIGGSRGFEVEAVPLAVVDGAPVSSTRVRELLGRGEVAGTARLLGRRYGLAGTVVRGEGVGRTLGVPTANLRLHEEKMVPAHGIYAAWARPEDARGWHAAALSIGTRPTFGGRVPAIEVHLLDWSGDLLGRDLEIEFVDWLREQVRFESADDLVLAMRQDLAEARRRLEGAPSPAIG